PLAGPADDRRGAQRALLRPLYHADGPRLARLLRSVAAHGGTRARRHRGRILRRRVAAARPGQRLLSVERRWTSHPPQPLQLVAGAPLGDERRWWRRRGRRAGLG